MNFIANSGIQFFTTPIEINLNDNFKMYFHESYDITDSQLKLEISHYFSEEEIWVKKHDLSLLGYAPNGILTDNWDNIKGDFEEEGYSPIPIDTDRPEDSGCFQVSINRIKWDKFENVWFPMPFFLLSGNKSEFKPTNWCRFKLIPVETNGKVRKYNLLLAFDTRSAFEKETFEDEDLNETPVFTSTYEKTKKFSLCNDEYKLIAYCSEAYNCDWVDKYLLKQFHQLENIKDYKGQKPKLNYLAQYIYLIRYIQQLDILPKITLYSNQNIAYTNVDLVVDIGNSRTCALLFDNGDFTKMSPLELQDFTTPVLNGEDPQPPGQVWVLNTGGQDEAAGLYKIEVNMGPGNGVKILNKPTPQAFQESVRYAEQNLYSKTKELVGDRDPRSYEFAVQLRSFDSAKGGQGIGMGVLIFLNTAILERSTKGGLVIVGQLNLGGSIDLIYNAVNLQN